MFVMKAPKAPPPPPPYVMSEEHEAKFHDKLRVVLQNDEAKEFVKDMLIAASRCGKYNFLDIVNIAGDLFPSE